jgi:uncharacterized protein (DUF1778 family)
LAICVLQILVVGTSTRSPQKSICAIGNFGLRLEKLVRLTYIWKLEVPMAMTAKHDRRLREERLGFRVDEPTKALIERAAQLERRKLTDFCMTALTDAARRTIAEHETLVLSDRDRAVFFDALVNPPAPSERLQRAFAEHKRRVVP